MLRFFGCFEQGVFAFGLRAVAKVVEASVLPCATVGGIDCKGFIDEGFGVFRLVSGECEKSGVVEVVGEDASVGDRVVAAGCDFGVFGHTFDNVLSASEVDDCVDVGCFDEDAVDFVPTG